MTFVKTGALSGVPIELKDADPADIVTKAITGLQATVEDRLTKLETKSTERMDRLEAKMNRPAVITDPKDEVSLERKAFASYCQRGKEGLGPEEVKALVVSNDTAGGYLAPPEVSTEMIRLLTPFSPIRSLATVRQTGNASVILPKRTGITNATWEGETDAASASEPAFGQVEIPTHGMKVYADISEQLLEDSVHNIEAELSGAFAEDFGKKESTAFVNGTGIKQPRGIMVHPDIAYTPGGDASLIKADGLIDIFHALPAAYRNAGIWLMNGTTLAAVRKLKATSGEYLWRDSLAEGNPGTILGRPVIEAIDMPDVTANAFPILFGDIAQAYRIYDRVALTVKADPFTQATNSLVRFHARRRVGGDVVKAEAIRKLKIATS